MSKYKTIEELLQHWREESKFKYDSANAMQSIDYTSAVMWAAQARELDVCIAQLQAVADQQKTDSPQS